MTTDGVESTPFTLEGESAGKKKENEIRRRGLTFQKTWGVTSGTNAGEKVREKK